MSEAARWRDVKAEIRQHLGLTQVQLAEATGLSQAWLL
jgi:predicted transcriptional regulator